MVAAPPSNPTVSPVSAPFDFINCCRGTAFVKHLATFFFPPVGSGPNLDASPAPPSLPLRRSRSPRPNATVITQAEIVDAGSSDAYLLVQKLRPVWLQKRGATSFSQEGDIVVYLDATSLGGRETLRNIMTDEIESIQFLDARRATLRFGSGHVNGAIVITARR